MSDSRRNKRKAKQLTEQVRAQNDFKKNSEFLDKFQLDTITLELIARRKSALRAIRGNILKRAWNKIWKKNAISAVHKLDMEVAQVELFARRKIALKAIRGSYLTQYINYLRGNNPLVDLISLDKFYNENTRSKAGPGTDQANN